LKRRKVFHSTLEPGPWAPDGFAFCLSFPLSKRPHLGELPAACPFRRKDFGRKATERQVRSLSLGCLPAMNDCLGKHSSTFDRFAAEAVFPTVMTICDDIHPFVSSCRAETHQLLRRGKPSSLAITPGQFRPKTCITLIHACAFPEGCLLLPAPYARRSDQVATFLRNTCPASQPLMFFFHLLRPATQGCLSAAVCIARSVKRDARWSNRFHHFPDCAGAVVNAWGRGMSTP